MDGISRKVRKRERSIDIQIRRTNTYQSERTPFPVDLGSDATPVVVDAEAEVDAGSTVAAV